MIFFIVAASTRVIKRIKQKWFAKKEEEVQKIEAENEVAEEDQQQEPLASDCLSEGRPETVSEEAAAPASPVPAEPEEKHGVIGKLQEKHEHLRNKRINLVKAIRE